MEMTAVHMGEKPVKKDELDLTGDKFRARWASVSAALVVVVGAAMWAANINAKVTSIGEAVTEIKAELKEGIKDRYHAIDASRDFALRDANIAEIRRRLEALEKK